MQRKREIQIAADKEDVNDNKAAAIEAHISTCVFVEQGTGGSLNI